MKILVHTGMRLGEIRIMRWGKKREMVTAGSSENFVYLIPSSKRVRIKFKGSNPRTLSLKNVWSVVDRLKNRKSDGDEYLFTSPSSGGQYTKSYICNRWKSEIEKCDALAYEYTSHSFRHAVVTELLREGYSYYKVGKLIGHSAEYVTRRYEHLVSEDLDGMMSVIGE